MRTEIEIPKICPTCSYTLVQVNAQLFCRNIACSARAKKGVEHFAKSLEIKGLGTASIEKLRLNHYSEIYSLTLERIKTCLKSDKLADKLFNEIDRSKRSDKSSIITAFGIPKVGKVMAQKLAKAPQFSSLTKGKCMEYGLGSVASDSVIDFINYEYSLIEDKLPFKNILESTQLESAEVETNIITSKVCITGKLSSFKTKAEASKALEKLGFTVTDNVTSDTSILIDETNKGSIKRTKAEQLGIPIINNLNYFIKERLNEHKEMDR